MQEVLVDVGPDAGWWGIADVPPAGDVDVLVWSKLGPCEVTQPAAPVPGETLGLIDPGHALLVAGSSLPFLLNLTTGVNLSLPQQLQIARTQATITPFAGGALIAGGVRSDDGQISQEAELFTLAADGSSGSFATLSLPALQPRAKAGALALPSGGTLLVGGLLALPNTLNTSMEIVSTAQELTELVIAGQTPRTNPVVLHLTNGQIFVGGGFDASGNPVATGEWYDDEPTTLLGTVDLRPLKGGVDGGMASEPTQYLFAPVEGGGVLAVIAGGDSNNVVVLPACDTIQTPCSPVPEPGVALDPKSQPLSTNATLFPAARSAPVLWTGTSWLRWNPWSASFAPMMAPPLAGTSTPGPAGLATLAVDPGLAAWVAGDGAFFGYRYDTRGPYANDSQVGDPIGPENTAPDRVTLPPKAVTGWQLGGTAGLTVGGGAKVFVTDATFDDVSVSATMGAAWADVVFRDALGCEYEIGGAVPSSQPCTVSNVSTCAFPPFQEGKMAVQRHGASVTVTFNGVELGACMPGFPASARLSVGVHAGTPGSVLTQLKVARGP